MPVVNTIALLTQWVQENICKGVKLKMAPQNDEPTDQAYEYKLVEPKAFPFFLPTADRLPPNVESVFPSICVRMVAGNDNLVRNKRQMTVQLCFSAWDNGLHSPDWMQFDKKRPWKFTQVYEEGEKSDFQKDTSGWMDTWNLVDKSLREIEINDSLQLSKDVSVRVMKENGIKFGPFAEQDAIPDFFPFWFAWLEFSVEESLFQPMQNYELLL